MDVCLPSDFLALRACVDSDWRDGCSSFGRGADSAPAAGDDYSAPAPTRPAQPAAKKRGLTPTHADPAWQVV